MAVPVGPYRDPSFRCTFVRYGNGQAPQLGSVPQDPLCVDYDKRDITLTDGGALRFLLAEPGRVLVAVPKCRYWQVDHWSIQVAPGDPPILRFNGSYWFDQGAGTGGAILRDFTVLGQPVGPSQAAALLAPLDPPLAAAVAAYGAGPGGGGGAGFALGAGNPLCPA